LGSINANVDLRRERGIAIITFDNPPVNALKYDVRAGIAEAIRQATDGKSDAIVLVGGGKTFSAGADITEFGKSLQSKAPTLLDLIALAENAPVPVVAALHGVPLGGGVELALACHFRVAAPVTRLGLPEIKLGLIPGAGATQRLPRLIGPEKSLAIILSGDPVPVKKAAEDGFVDAIVDGDLTQEAIAFARRVVDERRPARRTRDLEDKLAAARANPAAYDEVAAQLTRRTKGQKAPADAVAAVRSSFMLPFDEGMKLERAAFNALLEGDQSKAARHIFFSEREAAKISGLPAGITPRTINRAAVIGGGTMGGGIAMCFANVGIPVTIVETGADALRQGLDRVAANYKTTVSRGSLSAAEMDKRMALLTGTTDFGAVGGTDIVIEAVFEEMDLKKKIFAELDRMARPGAILASNTSTLDVDEIASATKRLPDVLGMHFFSPANVMKLLEVVRARATAPDVLATAMALGRRLNKVPVVVGVCDGFVGNRMLARRGKETERLLLEGAMPADVDAAVTEFGFPMGPFAMNDLVGLDVSWRIRKGKGDKAVIADALCEAGKFGQKTGSGYYRYEKGERTPLPNPDVEKLIVEMSKRLGITRRTISRDEITERTTFPIIDEGARILEEGMASRPGDIDVIWIYGYGWPVWRGGPMFHADLVGLPRICDRLAEYAARTGDDTLKPAPLLQRLAREGRGFGSISAGKGGTR
jgi:3-hydroxyacyl-CoA dehydrogenase